MCEPDEAHGVRLAGPLPAGQEVVEGRRACPHVPQHGGVDQGLNGHSTLDQIKVAL